MVKLQERLKAQPQPREKVGDEAWNGDVWVDALENLVPSACPEPSACRGAPSWRILSPHLKSTQRTHPDASQGDA